MCGSKMLLISTQTKTETGVRESLTDKRNSNDPSAGSPTETLLRLLYRSNDHCQIQQTDIYLSAQVSSPRVCYVLF